jgi:hypothetical protein
LVQGGRRHNDFGEVGWAVRVCNAMACSTPELDKADMCIYN